MASILSDSLPHQISRNSSVLNQDQLHLSTSNNAEILLFKELSFPVFRLQNIQQFFLYSSHIRTIQLPQWLQQIFDCLFHWVRIYLTDAIAYQPHLLTLRKQVVEGLQMLQPNRILPIPHSHSTAKLIHFADNRPTPAFALQLRIVFGKDLADFVNLIGVWYFRAFHDPLHYVFDDSTCRNFSASNFNCW